MDAWPPKNHDFAWEVLQKRCFRQVAPKSEKKTAKSHENNPRNLIKNCKKRDPKMDLKKAAKKSRKGPQDSSPFFIAGEG